MKVRRHFIDDGLLDEGFVFIPQREWRFISEYAKKRFGFEYQYTHREYKGLRESASKMRLDPRDIEEFDRDYCSYSAKQQK